MATIRSFLEQALELPAKELLPGTPPNERPNEMALLGGVLHGLAEELMATEGGVSLEHGCIPTTQEMGRGIRIVFRVSTCTQLRSIEISLEEINDNEGTITALKNRERIEPPETVAELQEHLRDLINEIKPTPP